MKSLDSSVKGNALVNNLDLSASISACRYCQYYNPVGRRGGSCQMLNVSVQAGWQACQLSRPKFTSSWENSEAIVA